MDGKRLLRTLTLKNFLSYGGDGATVDLLPLNVLVGSNASGKSNLIESLAILRATSSDLAARMREGGGIQDYVWKGAQSARAFQIDALVELDRSLVLSYTLVMAPVGTRAHIVQESVWDSEDRELFYNLALGKALIQVRSELGDRGERAIPLDSLVSDQSILSQRRDPDHLPELTSLAAAFERIAIFQELNFGQRTATRLPQRADLPTDFLLPDASNLGLVLNEIQHRSDTRRKVIHYLKKFYESVEHVSTKITSGTVQILIEEQGRNEPIPATRLSDGTLRYLSLLAILCHPDPPPLICLEEPELGMHPDVLPTIAELLVDASQRTQLVVTTHSDVLVSALSDTPEAIVVCEPSPEGTQLRRLDRESLSEWLKKYSLGEIWRMGEIGGTRW